MGIWFDSVPEPSMKELLLFVKCKSKDSYYLANCYRCFHRNINETVQCSVDEHKMECYCLDLLI